MTVHHHVKNLVPNHGSDLWLVNLWRLKNKKVRNPAGWNVFKISNKVRKSTDANYKDIRIIIISVLFWSDEFTISSDTSDSV